MEMREWLTILGITTNAMLIPLVTSYWRMQGRISRIEGVVDYIAKKVR